MVPVGQEATQNLGPGANDGAVRWFNSESVGKFSREKRNYVLRQKLNLDTVNLLLNVSQFDF